MRRRTVLAALPSLALAGCVAGTGSDDAETTTTRTPPPGVELVEFTVPEAIEAGREAPVGAVLKNTGDVERSGTARLEFSPDGENWHGLAEDRYSLAPREQAVVETRASIAFLGRVSLRLVPFDERTVVETFDRSLYYGSEHALPNGVTVVVSDPESVDSYEYSENGERRTATRPDDRTWARTTVTVRNTGETAAVAPYRTSFEMMGYDWRGSLPYRATDAYRGGELDPGASRTGSVLFETRFRRVDQPIRLRHPYRGGVVGATWTEV